MNFNLKSSYILNCLKKSIYVLIFFFFTTSQVYSYTESNKKIGLINKLYFAGFSFTGDYENKKEVFKFFRKFGDKKISKFFINIAQNLNTKYFDLLADPEKNKLIKLNDNDANILAFAITHEDFAIEKSYNSGREIGFYEAYFNIIIYDFNNRNLLNSIPVSVHLTISKPNKITTTDILSEIEKLYFGEGDKIQDSLFFKDIQKKLENLKVKRKYTNKVGITKTLIESDAKKMLPPYLKKNLNAYKNYASQVFLANLSKHHDLAFVPYNEGELYGKTLKLRFVNQRLIHNVYLPDPDIHIYLKIMNFKNVLAEENASEKLFYYASYINIKFIQPELSEINEEKGTYFDENLRGVQKETIPKGIAKVDDWRKYMFNYNSLCNDFSVNIKKFDNNWAKLTHQKPSQLKKSLKTLYKKIN